MTAIEIARRFAELDQCEDACKAYKLALNEYQGDPSVELESSAYILQHGQNGDYKVAYTIFHDLYNRGVMKNSVLSIMDAAFYEPNVRLLRNRYERNCKLLRKYPYIFREDYPDFEDLPIKFYPFDDNSYTPLYRAEERFGDYINFRETVIKHNFFKDLEKPILAEDIFSQYELEYLRDNVRRSEDIARENHIYLHYKDWGEFCSNLACINLRPILEEKKVVFLFGEEIKLYPIDFKERFGIDYSKFTLQPVRVRDISRLIWHTQLSTHNGGDFFNEIFDAHPNLLAMPSIMMENAEKIVKEIRKGLKMSETLQEALQQFKVWNNPQIVEEIYHNRECSDKDLLVANYLCQEISSRFLDKNSRIFPALFFQPHFSNIVFDLKVDFGNKAVLHSEEYERVKNSPFFTCFKYIKAFTPMRRFTTSHAATVRFMYNSTRKDQADRESKAKDNEAAVSVVSDAVSERILNRSFMLDPDDRLYKDSVLVRFEDGKLNPKATFTALASFLDIPYTESMTYCSENGTHDVIVEDEFYGVKVAGFDLSTVYKTYDEYANENERKFIEYFLRDAYKYYGYDFQYLDTVAVDEALVNTWIDGFDTINDFIRKTWIRVFEKAKVSVKSVSAETDISSDAKNQLLEDYLLQIDQNRRRNVGILMRGLNFLNKRGQPLKLMPKLQLDPALLEQPLYH